MDQGSFLPSISGYQLMTMRTIISREATLSNGLSTSDSVPADLLSSAASSNTACAAAAACGSVAAAATAAPGLTARAAAAAASAWAGATAAAFRGHCWAAATAMRSRRLHVLLGTAANVLRWQGPSSSDIVVASGETGEQGGWTRAQDHWDIPAVTMWHFSRTMMATTNAEAEQPSSRPLSSEPAHF